MKIALSLSHTQSKARSAPTKEPQPQASGGVDQFQATPEPEWRPLSAREMNGLKAQVTKGVLAPDYTRVFDRQRGWTGADGAYSVPLPNGDTLWMFSDTFWGEVTADGARHSDTKFLNNTLALQNPDGEFQFLHGGKEGQPKTVFVPPDGKGWFWLHDAVVDEKGKATVTLGQFDKTEDGGSMGFKAIGSWTAELEMTDSGPKVDSYQKIPHYQSASDGKPNIFFGSASLVEGDYTYLYGVADTQIKKDGLLARVKTESISKPEVWEFFDGEAWSKDMQDASVFAEDVAYEYSVHKSKQGDFVMVTQGGFMSPDIQIRRSERPEGPWSEPKTVWTTPEQTGSDITYNAKAHPELSDERGLLISYNVNTLDNDRNLAVADIYRPRFIRVPDKSLLP